MISHVSNFVFPNDHGHLTWTIMIVLYPYFTGLVAGAFAVAALYYVFGKKELEPVARLALAASFCFCAFATTPLLLHLHQPLRAFNIMFTPNFTSAMSGFGFIYTFYLVLLAVEIVLVFRPQILARGRASHGVMKLVYRVLALGVTHESARSREVDHKWIRALSIIGIPAACVLTGYTGFIFGAMKANPWWSSAAMPLIFLMSAIVSGVAVLVLIYSFSRLVARKPIDDDCVRSMLKTLWLFLIVALALEELDLLNKAYEAGAAWEIMHTLIDKHIHVTHFWVQTVLGAVVPLILLPIAFSPRLGMHMRVRIGGIASLLVLMQVLAMRWNVVIGGQLFSKSLRGFRDYVPELLGREGVLAGVLLLAAPFFLLWIAGKVLPLWHDEERDSKLPELAQPTA